MCAILFHEEDSWSLCEEFCQLKVLFTRDNRSFYSIYGPYDPAPWQAGHSLEKDVSVVRSA